MHMYGLIYYIQLNTIILLNNIKFCKKIFSLLRIKFVFQIPRGHSSSSYSGTNILLKSDGSIDHRCSAYRSGYVTETSYGTVSKQCAAYRDGAIYRDSDNQYHISAIHQTQDLHSDDYRKGYQEQKYRTNSQSKNKENQHTCHVVGCTTADQIIKHISPTISEQNLKEIKKYLNEDNNLQMKLISSNQKDSKLESKINDFLDGKEVRFTRQDTDALEYKQRTFQEQMAKAKQDGSQGYYLMQDMDKQLTKIVNEAIYQQGDIPVEYSD